MSQAIGSLRKTWFYVISILFVLANAMMLWQEQYWFLLVPAALWFVFFITFSIDKSLLFITFITPLSILIDVEQLGISFTLPTEPLLLGMMLLFYLKLLIEGRYDTRALYHPISLAIVFYLLWMIFTTISSSMPLTSFKFFLSNLWFITCFYFIALQLFRKRENLQRWLWLYLLPLTFVILWSIYNHSTYGFTKQASYWASEPFVMNHGIYGAMIAFFFPMIVVYIFKLKVFTKRPLMSFLMLVLLVIFTVGIILSYTRAAWLGVAAALGFYIWLQLRLRFWTLLTTLGSLAVIFFSFQTQITMALMENKTDSADDLGQHVQSISNVRTDASNLERLNRWASGWRMLQERPWLGWGPGTYMFQYAPFQKPDEKTIISTNAADVGGIHSEYLNPLVEMGIPGFVLFMLIIGFSLQRAMSLYYRLQDPYIKNTLLIAMLGLATYLTHGVLNDYLDIDKTALLYWSFLAMITAIDVYHNDQAPYPNRPNPGSGDLAP
ncbi:MAG: O-antigen ligase family protein [Sphingobacteriaceae bacterium]|nr:O-antigen ligase family protein [Sphingobacteriaceae bacterium]